MKLVDEAWDEAWEIVNTEDGWKEEKKNSHGDVVVSKKSKKGEGINLSYIYQVYLIDRR